MTPPTPPPTPPVGAADPKDPAVPDRREPVATALHEAPLPALTPPTRPRHPVLAAILAELGERATARAEDPGTYQIVAQYDDAP
ncbi:hypothetical protein [Streptomyces sp. NPDC050560]|uniref:hypothetical protein n=1 Tax=Streptomyces sp. NPDC050560 TaxID=3365630 RepID=UPI0037A6483C